MSWLAPIVKALDEREAPATVFLRNDDAGWDHNALARLIDTTSRHGVVVDLAAIPQSINNASASSLRAWHDNGVVRIHQHGYSHQNHEAEGRKCEFGPSRPLAQQRSDIATGHALLRDHFGDRLDSVFTPPWNRCTQHTIEALRFVGIRALSCDLTASPLDTAGVVELPVTVDWFSKKGPLAQTRTAQLVESLATRPVTGIMLHHNMGDASDAHDLNELLGAVGGHSNLRFAPMAQLAQATAPA